MNLQTLVDDFLSTEEFQKVQETARSPIVVDLDGFRLNIRENDYYVGGAIARDKIYEPPVTAMVRELLKPGDCFVDIGANIGYFTCMAAALVGPAGNVYAFEPNPDNIDLIKRSIDANSFTNVQLFPFAVAEMAQTFKLDASSSSSNARIIDFSAEAVPGLYAPRIVEAVTLDDTLGGVPRIDVIKVDIEGAEPRAWQGMQRIVHRHRPIILFEYSPVMIRDTSHIEPASFLDQFIDAGYELFLLVGDRERSHLSLSREQIEQAQNASSSTHLDLVAFPK